MRVTRSHVHMVTVAAARLAADYANPQLVADLRKAAEEMATAIAEGRGHTPDDDRRIERQRTLFTMLPDCRASDALKQASRRASTLTACGSARSRAPPRSPTRSG